MAYLLVNILVMTYPALRVITVGILRANRDIFLGIFMPPKPKRIHDSYLVFRGSGERIKALEMLFRKMFDAVDLRAGYMVQLRKRGLSGWRCIVPPSEVLKD